MILFILILLIVNVIIIDFIFYKVYKNMNKTITHYDLDYDFWNEKED